MIFRNTVAFVILLLPATCQPELSAGDWPAFRGPRGDGISDETGVPLVWGPDRNVRWRFALPGPGNSSPVVYRGRIFITCAENGGHQRSLYCLDGKSGELVWQRTIEYAEEEVTHKTNPWCGSTPLAFESSIVVWHGSAGLYCYDLDGQQKWHTDLGKVGHIWGYGSSPFLHDGLIYLNFGPGEQQFVCAVDASSGKMAWKTEEPGGQNQREPRMVGSWSTPSILKVGDTS